MTSTQFRVPGVRAPSQGVNGPAPGPVGGPVIQGWCPGALRPMLSGDGYVVRVRPQGGRLTQEQAAGIAALALAHGNGLIDLSARANVQLRGVTETSHAPLIDGLRSLGLIDDCAEAEARRNIVVTPFWSACEVTPVLAAALAAALTAKDAPALPGKFGFAVDTGPIPVLRAVSADIRLERGPSGLICRADGAGYGAAVTAETAVTTALALARWFAANGGIREGRGRMAAHLARGAVLPEAFARSEATVVETYQPVPGRLTRGTLVGFEFGQMRAETLAALAALAPLRVTPWRMLFVEGAEVPAMPGIIRESRDPMLHVLACTGAPGCVQALQPTRALARALAPHVPLGDLLHVAGCAKGCAHPEPCAVTLVARARGFAVIRNGAAAEAPDAPVFPAATLTCHPETLFDPTPTDLS
ncbi:precorrin-3B synthase [Paracoccaceae bacterium Fryx2]|nr:precorrin-3B synthase [Paracoccaceae bacterium Fryx2]